MKRENIKKANELNEQLVELEEFFNSSSSFEATVSLSNGGEAAYNKKIPAKLYVKAREGVMKVVSDEIVELKRQIEKL